VPVDVLLDAPLEELLEVPLLLELVPPVELPPELEPPLVDEPELELPLEVVTGTQSPFGLQVKPEGQLPSGHGKVVGGGIVDVTKQAASAQAATAPTTIARFIGGTLLQARAWERARNTATPRAAVEVARESQVLAVGIPGEVAASA